MFNISIVLAVEGLHATLFWCLTGEGLETRNYKITWHLYAVANASNENPIRPFPYGRGHVSSDQNDCSLRTIWPLDTRIR